MAAGANRTRLRERRADQRGGDSERPDVRMVCRGARRQRALRSRPSCLRSDVSSGGTRSAVSSRLHARSARCHGANRSAVHGGAVGQRLSLPSTWALAARPDAPSRDSACVRVGARLLRPHRRRVGAEALGIARERSRCMIVVEVLLLIAALVLIVMTVELITRTWLKHRARYYVFPPGLRLRIHPDREVFPKHPHTLNYVINSEGERGGEPPSSTEGVYRVLVAGGSQPEGYFLDQDTTWPAVVQRLLQRSDRLATLGASKVHVGAIARSGVGSEGLDLILGRILPQYPRLQLVIIMVGASDVLRWIELGTPDVFKPVVVSDVFRCHPEGPFGWTPQRLAMTELIRRARRRWLRPVTVDDHAGRWIGRARRMRARAMTLRTVIRDPEPMLDHFEHHFRRLLLSAKAHADRVLVVRQPWFDKVCSRDEAASMWHGGVGQAWREEVTTYYSLEVFSKV